MTAFHEQDRVGDIIRRRLLRAPIEIKALLPDVLSKPDLAWMTYWTERYLVLAFLDLSEKKRTEKLIEKQINPFPGLIADTPSSDAAFSVENSRNILVSGCKISNMFTLCLGENCTVVVCDHSQSIDTSELGDYNYVVHLAYIISFGTEISMANVCDYLEEVIAYSIKNWTSNNGKGK